MKANEISLPRVLFFALLFLLFFQTLADFVEAVYAFGLMSTGIPPQIVSVLLLLSPFLLLFFPQRPSTRSLYALLFAFLLARALIPLMNTYGRMLTAGIGIAAWGILFPVLFTTARGSEEGQEMALGLMLAVPLSALLRTVGLGLDVSTVGWGQVVGWGFVFLAALLGPYALQGRGTRGTNAMAPSIWADAIGVVSVFALLYFVFTAPHVLARWTGVDYRWIVLGYAAGWIGMVTFLGRRGMSFPFEGTLLFLFALALAWTAKVHQPVFPTQPDAYPLAEPIPSATHAVPLALTLLLYPILFFSANHFFQRLTTFRPSPRRAGVIFGFAFLYLLVLIFGHVFTTVYDYIPVVGPFFRNRFWQIHLVVGGVLWVAFLLQRNSVPQSRVPRLVLVGGIGILVLTIGTAFWLTPRPHPPAEVPNRITVMAYNIQQGYSKDGQRNFAGQLRVIRGVQPDILGLAETDDARIANGNADVVRYLAYHLNMYAYYGPKTPTGTFGIALLSRYPIRSPRTWFLYSEGEQVAAIEADVIVGGQVYHVFVTHLGNGGPMIQLEQLLSLVDARDRTIVMGDFNFQPNTIQYKRALEFLVDTWTARWPNWVNDRGCGPVDKIDHIFVSPDLQVLDADYLIGPASDHPAVTATLSNHP